MIGSLHSTYTFYHRKGKVLGLAIYIGHQGSTKGMVGVMKSFLFLGGRCTLSPRSFYLLYRNRS